MISNVLNNKLMTDLIETACLEGLHKRYPNFTKVIVVTLTGEGVVKISTSIPSKNLSGISVSIRGCEYIYEWLDKIAREFPLFNRYLMGFYKPTEEYHKDIDWTLKS